MKRADFLFNVALVPTDFIMLLAAGFAAYFLRLSPFVSQWRPVLFNLPFLYYFSLTLALSAFFLIIFAVSGLYKARIKRSQLEEFFQVVVSVSAGMMLIIIFMFFKREWFDSRFIMLAAWFFGIVFAATGRALAAKVRRYLMGRHAFGVEQVLIVGNGKEARLIREEIEGNPHSGYAIMGQVSDMDIENIRSVVENPACLAGRQGKRVQKIILANPSADRGAVIDLVNFCEDMRIDLKFVPDLFGSMAANIDIDILRGNPLIELKRTNLDGWGLIVKRIMDFVGALALLPFLVPPFLVIGFFIKWESKGPVFVKLKRVSRGKEFYLLKFRSMIVGAEQYKNSLMRHNEREDGPLFKMRDDPRITKVGRIIRSKRIDELPQVFNVLSGDISLVGPRPHEPQEIARYARHHKKVLAIKSGITGLAQISGAERLPFEEEVKLDRYYIEHWSIGRDFVILLKTLGVLLFGRTEY